MNRSTAVWMVLATAFAASVGVIYAQSTHVHTIAIGRIVATDQEQQECYFSIGTGTMLALRPESAPCLTARSLLGRTGTLMFVAD